MSEIETDGALDLVRVVRGVRPLSYVDGSLVCWHNGRLLVTNDFGQTFQRTVTLPVSSWMDRLARLHPRIQQVLRLHPFRLRADGTGGFVLSMPPGVYSRAHAHGPFRVFSDFHGRRPCSLDATPEGEWVFGEYPQNVDKSLDIRVFSSQDSGANWRVRHTFPAGSIRHIHGVSYDRWAECFWLCCGDKPQESIVFRAAKDFSEIVPVMSGSPETRLFWIHVTETMLVTATDSPNSQNYILRFDKNTGEMTRVCPIQNSSFYCGSAGDALFVSTNAEPPEESNQVATNANDTNASYVWAARPPYTNWKQVLQFPIDIFQRLTAMPAVPKALFQYPTVILPDGENGSPYLVVYCMGLRRYGGRMVVYDTSKLQFP